ncbi:MAG TPA: haloacid dehalogenase [Lachnoclostridium sp.]|jgi:HAD superfamily hydrolase (TIGR01484 family)|uniref:HAD family hydrolase n=1 Tax=Lacrimispora sp. TaxID=2719234 RepID=UPI000EDD31C9|nr:HAD family hydrolase [Lacrimispora sp.]HCD46296.1 haloacid dehalogenase [Lachnoclostridium sp.]
MKCAVSDFDRTLYIGGSISPRNLNAIDTWQAAGNRFVIATGRNESSVRVFLEKYSLRPDALILNNGALILDGKGKELFCRTIDDQTAREVLQYLHGLGGEGSGVSMRSGKVNVLSDSGATTQKPCDGQLSIDQIHCLKEIVQIHRRRQDVQWIRTLCSRLNARFPLICAYANVWNGDIVAKGVNKSAAVAWISRYWGGFDEIRVIGDSSNDLEMIKDYGGATLRSGDGEIQAAAAMIVEDVAEYLSMQ